MHDSDLIDEPASEGPPGRRLSTSIGGLHPIAWVSILFALGELVWLIVNATFLATPSPADLVVYGLTIFPDVAAILLPAALLARHPDATTRAPLLLLGTLLFALYQGLLVLAVPLQPIFATITPASDEVSLVPLAEIYNGLTLLTAVIGLGLIARGLSLARRFEDRSSMLIELYIPAAMIFATVVGIVAVSRLALPDPLPAIDLVYLAANVILGVLRIAVWAYLTTSAVRGLLAREEPIVGWGLAALGGAVIVLALAVVNLAGVVDITDPTIGQALGWIIVVAYALGHLSLLVAFVVGLPAIDDFEDDDEAGYRGGPVYENEFPDERIR